MQILDIQIFSGRNIYSHKPVIKVLADIGELYRYPTKDIEGFNEKILEYLPGLKKHYCSLGYEGGFLERLNEGTYIGHVAEHMIIEIQNMLGYDVHYGKTRVEKEPSVYYIVYEYINERCGIECARTIFEIINEILNNEEVDFSSKLERLRQIALEYDLGPSTKAIYVEAKKRGIPVTRIGNGSLIQLGYGKYSRLIQASLTDLPSCISVDIASNKDITKKILRDYMIPVPDGDITHSVEGAIFTAKNIGFPVVVKPLDGNQGKGVTVNVNTEEEVKAAFIEAKKYSNSVLVEEYINGNDYRLLVVGNKVSAASERRPPFVTGDGIHTIWELVEIENSNELRGVDHEKPLTKIKLDDLAKKVLHSQGCDENYIPKDNEVIFLRYNSNISTGGTARDCTEEVHPLNAELAVKAAKALGLDIAGIDVCCEDISKPLYEQKGAIIEVNASPGLRMHIYPSAGESRNVAEDIINMMFPEGKEHSIPIVSVTGTNGKTTTTRLIAHVLKVQGKRVGMTTTSGIYIDGQCLMKGDNTGSVSARLLLSNKTIDAAVLETARGGIIRKGLGYDLADVGVITNISEDHLGIDGVNTLEDLAFVKSLVIEAVKSDGYAVINADDKFADYFLKRARSEVILFSKDKHNPLLNNHIEQGKMAVFIENDEIIMINKGIKMHLIKVQDIPITFSGMLDCNIENCLAAVSALLGLNMPLEIIERGLKTFLPDTDLNAGRFNIFNMGEFKVMLDYGHNPAGIQEVVKFIKKLEAKRFVGVVGMPGDRQDSSISKAARICAGAFDRLYIKEDSDLRGRDAGEVAQIFYDAIIKCGVPKENVEIVYSEGKALEKAILDAQPGDFIVMFYEDFKTSLDIINELRAEIQNNNVKAEEMVQNVG
ncbi:cyanophycin synthetase [Acetivibrio clariflavus]|uniref:Cyanophycin synthetase n=1 Tax=Acetivibrio clariflavus (strain DSM 19732 / NBRC 101661 / EBR45) TaxID=720554 RepID=G8LSX9_ACECE|nr:cyanophycin synthetase [Acetivibrio clariflavus]AEV70492.1 cyanophycin synthetase [Acetivibrio clariflavus DSM 19732]